MDIEKETEAQWLQRKRNQIALSETDPVPNTELDYMRSLNNPYEYQQ